MQINTQDSYKEILVYAIWTFADNKHVVSHFRYGGDIRLVTG